MKNSIIKGMSFIIFATGSLFGIGNYFFLHFSISKGGLELPTNKLESFLNNLFLVSFLISIFASLSLGFIVYLQLKKSFSELLRISDAVENKNYEQRFSSTTSNEIEKLGHCFNSLLDNISNMQKEFLTQSQSLEDKVKERTRDLEIQKVSAEFSKFEAEVAKQTAEKTLAELKDSQEKLIRSEKMIALGQLVDGVAHEMNTPLGAIKASAEHIKKSMKGSAAYIFDLIRYLKIKEINLIQSILILNFNNEISSREERALKKSMTNELLSRNIPNAYEVAETLIPLGITDISKEYDHLWLHEKNKEILQLLDLQVGLEKRAFVIEKSVDKTSKIVNVLKTFSNENLDKKKEINLIDGLETTITIYGNFLRKGIVLQRKYDFKPLISCYPEKLIQVWNHLLQNSIHAIQTNGEIIISVKEGISRPSVLVSFQDNGKGISDEIKEKIFDPFFTTKKSGEGSGLGLHICREIISQHSGTISFESNPKKTIFTVEIPYS
jgi:two-component system, NtrC family, sensor kinase